jgi:hypothetical protein
MIRDVVMRVGVKRLRDVMGHKRARAISGPVWSLLALSRGACTVHFTRAQFGKGWRAWHKLGLTRVNSGYLGLTRVISA